MLDNTCSKRTKTLSSVNLLKYIWSSRFFIPKRCTGFGWRKKLGSLTSSEAFQLWKLFFRTVSIIWGDVSQKCCQLKILFQNLTVFRIFKFLSQSQSQTFWPWIPVKKCDSNMLNRLRVGNSFVFCFLAANLAVLRIHWLWSPS